MASWMHAFLSTKLSLAILTFLGLLEVAPGAASVAVDFVPVGNLGNPSDTNHGYGPLGSVNYLFSISKNETTAGQYCAFLNAVAKSDPYHLYSTGMSSFSYLANIARTGSSGNYSYSVISGDEQRPVTLVSWFDAARFCNWMNNGQGNGSTETGAYTLNGAMSGLYSPNPGANYWLPTENEWYKAAYYDPTKGGTGGYWAYPTRTNSMPGNTPGVTGAANYDDGDYVGYPSGEATTNAGAYGPGSASYYGTNDQGGNAYEWLDFPIAGERQAFRGGAWGDLLVDLSVGYRPSEIPTYESAGLGFRIATVPEPSSLLLSGLCSFCLIRRRRAV